MTIVLTSRRRKGGHLDWITPKGRVAFSIVDDTSHGLLVHPSLDGITIPVDGVESEEDLLQRLWCCDNASSNEMPQ